MQELTLESLAKRVEELERQLAGQDEFRHTMLRMIELNSDAERQAAEADLPFVVEAD